ncbi:MAG: azurin [Rhodanobacteraceae bacterium]|nr:azurin [Rhodanobacteraceae bacterium]
MSPPMRTVLYAFLLLASGTASAGDCLIELKADDAMKFDRSEVAVAASCKSIEIKLTHTGKLPVAAMGHNVVIAATADLQPIAQDGQKAGAAANYVAAGDKRVIAHTPLVGGGASTSATFAGSALKPGGDYTFFCSFPGHWAIMKGKLSVK